MSQHSKPTSDVFHFTGHARGFRLLSRILFSFEKPQLNPRLGFMLQVGLQSHNNRCYLIKLLHKYETQSLFSPRNDTEAGEAARGMRARWHTPEPGSELTLSSPLPGTFAQQSSAAREQRARRELLLGFETQSTFVCTRGCFSNTRARRKREALLTTGHLFAH